MKNISFCFLQCLGNSTLYKILSFTTVQLVAGARDFSLLQSVKIGSGAQLASSSMSTGDGGLS